MIMRPLNAQFPLWLLLLLAACQAPAPKLQADAQVNTRLQNPTYAQQAPDKIKNVSEREKQIYTYLANADLAWAREDYDALRAIYADLEHYDPGNLRAKEGLIQVQKAERQQLAIAEAEALMANNKDSDDEKALSQLRLVLLQSPLHPKALPLYNSLLGKQAAQLSTKQTKKLIFNQPLTMEFRDVNLKMIFESLAKTTKINFILDKDVPSDTKATIFAKNMAFNDALDLLLQTNQLEKKVLSENSVIIYTNDGLHKRDYKDLSVRSFTLDYADAKQMSTILRSMLNMQSIEIDPRLNTLLIKDSPEILALAEKIIYAQDKPDAEVMLEVQVLEVKSSFLQNLGVNAPTGLALNATDGNVNLLANPRIRVKNKNIALIHIGEKVPVFTANVASTGVTTQNVQYIDAGLKLEVEPTISSTDDVTIKVNLNVNSIGEQIKAISGNSESIAFRVGTRLASTQLRLHDGETQVLAGLIDDQERKSTNKVPGIGDFPLLGRLFSKQKDDKSKTEIMLSITPHIIRPRQGYEVHEADVWVGPEGQTGRSSPSPGFGNGMAPFMVPKPRGAASPAVKKDEAPNNINLPLPAGFSLGRGAGLSNGEGLNSGGSMAPLPTAPKAQ
jgi:general secretion pathway protein D